MKEANYFNGAQGLSPEDGLQTLTLCRATKFTQLSMRLDDFRGPCSLLRLSEIAAQIDSYV